MTSDVLPAPCAITASGYTGTDNGWKAFDTSTSTRWLSDNSSVPHSIIYNYGAGRAVVINKYAWASNTGENPRDFTLQGSNNGSSWTTLDTRTSIANPNVSWGSAADWAPYFTFKNSTAHQYYKLNVTALNSGSTYLNLVELKLVQSTQLSSRYEPWVTGTAYKVGMRVTSSNTYACIDDHTAGTFATDLANDCWVQVNADGTDTLDGVSVYANSGAYKGYRWLGLVRLINSTGAKFVDSVNQRFVANGYNTKTKNGVTNNSGSQWDYVVPVWRESNASTSQNKCEFVTINPITASMAVMLQSTSSGSASQAEAGIALDNLLIPVTGTIAQNYTASTTTITSGSTTCCSLVSPGYHFVSILERQSSGTARYYASNLYGVVILKN